MKYSELHELGNEKAVKEAGKYRQEGKNYVVNDGDVIFFKCAARHSPYPISLAAVCSPA
jgi:ribosome-binding ATPase YchF (GTP1/OBG family)